MKEENKTLHSKIAQLEKEKAEMAKENVRLRREIDVNAVKSENRCASFERENERLKKVVKKVEDALKDKSEEVERLKVGLEESSKQFEVIVTSKSSKHKKKLKNWKATYENNSRFDIVE